MNRTVARIVGIGLLAAAGCFHQTPGSGRRVVPEVLSSRQSRLVDELRNVVETLATNVGPREATYSLQKLYDAQQWIEQQLGDAGVQTSLDEVMLDAVAVHNVVATFSGTKQPDEIIVLGAHYDTVPNSPGANDNASGVAVALAVARRLRDDPPERTVRVVFFVNEELPFGGGPLMGSRVYAGRCRERGDDIVAMISLDSLGYYSTARGSQRYPPIVRWMLPPRADFVGFVANKKNQPLLDEFVTSFRRHASISSIGVAIDQRDVGRSDHASFWLHGYPAILVTDTANFRDDAYHTPRDTADRLDYGRLALVAEGLCGAIIEISQVTTPARTFRRNLR